MPMFVVEAKRQGDYPRNLPWIAALLSKRDDAEAILAQVRNAKTDAFLYEVASHGFPIYLIEDRGFRFVQLDELRRYLTDLDGSRITDDYVPIIYRLEAEFGLEDQGRDQMGGLDHIHVDHSFLQAFRSRGGKRDPFDGAAEDLSNLID